MQCKHASNFKIYLLLILIVQCMFYKKQHLGNYKLIKLHQIFIRSARDLLTGLWQTKNLSLSHISAATTSTIISLQFLNFSSIHTCRYSIQANVYYLPRSHSDFYFRYLLEHISPYQLSRASIKHDKH